MTFTKPASDIQCTFNPDGTLTCYSWDSPLLEDDYTYSVSYTFAAAEGPAASVTGTILDAATLDTIYVRNTWGNTDWCKLDLLGLPVLEWVGIEPSEEEEDGSAAVPEVSESARAGLEGLDGGIERLGHRIGDPAPEVFEQAEQALLARERDPLDRIELAAPGLRMPLGNTKVS